MFPDMENIKEALQLARHAAKHTAFVLRAHLYSKEGLYCRS